LPQSLFYGHFPLYTDTSKYNGARVVQVSYIIADEKYNKLEESDTIIKADNFLIENDRFHGITNEISQSRGISFEEFAEGFSNSLDFVHTLVAHNINFDFNVICAELYRYNKLDIIAKLESKKQICTMKRYKTMVGAKFNNTLSYGIKDPNLKELYHYATGEIMEHHHNSMYDVLNLLKAVKAIETI
jgi:DNA polymerase III epsilon subunit-like protein